MPLQKKSFTVTYSDRAEVLKTPCKISFPFDSDSHIGATPEYCQFEAVWDTGATMTSVSSEVVKQCGLKAHSMTVSHTANGICPTPVYKINIALINGVSFKNLSVTESKLPPPTHVLIGMDIISQGDFAVTNKNNKTIFSYQYPSDAEIDFVQKQTEQNERALKNQTILFIKTEGNKLCHCGSKKKFRYCHGKLAS